MMWRYCEISCIGVRRVKRSLELLESIVFHIHLNRSSSVLIEVWGDYWKKIVECYWYEYLTVNIIMDKI